MSSGSRKKRQSVAQTAGGVLFGFEQQVFRNSPPPEEVVHHARHDGVIAAGDGSYLSLELPEDADTGADTDADDPWAGIEDELGDEEDPWAEYAAEAETTSAGGKDAPDPKLKRR